MALQLMAHLQQSECFPAMKLSSKVLAKKGYRKEKLREGWHLMSEQ
jgi:hypothetical protein